MTDCWHEVDQDIAQLQLEMAECAQAPLYAALESGDLSAGDWCSTLQQWCEWSAVKFRALDRLDTGGQR